MNLPKRAAPDSHRDRDGDPADGGARRSRKLSKGSWLVAAGIAAAFLAGGIGLVILSGGGSSNAAPPRAIEGTATAIVQRRDLVETDIQTGTLGYCGNLNVYGRLAGTVTWVPSTGTVIYPDHALYRVEGNGVYLLDGTQPVRRALKTGMSDGTDVTQLNRDLRTMGYDPNHEIELGDHFSEATEAAVKRWQDAHGLEQTGEIEFGRIVFQPGPRRVQKVYLSLGGSATPQASSSTQATTTETATATCRHAPGRAAASSNAAYRAPALPGTVTDATGSGEVRIQDVAFTQPATSSAPTTTTPPTPTTAAPTATTPTTSAPTPSASPTPTTTGTAPKSPEGGTGSGGNAGKGTKSSKPQSRGGNRGSGAGGAGTAGAKGAGAGTGSTAATPSSTSASPSSTSAGSGTQGSSPGVALVTTSLQRVVTVSLEASKQSEARIGEAVQVTLPSNEVISGHIAGVAPAAISSSASSGSGTSNSSTVSVEVTLDSNVRGGGLDQAPVSVAFATQRQNGVLSIPVTALVATASGGYAVEQVQGTKRKLIPVTPGIYAGGFVAVSGVPEGTLVTNASQ